jgi:hypothetical protein
MSDYREAFDVDAILLMVVNEAREVALLLPAAHEISGMQSPAFSPPEPEVQVSTDGIQWSPADPTADTAVCPNRLEVRRQLIKSEALLVHLCKSLGAARKGLVSAMDSWEGPEVKKDVGVAQVNCQSPGLM